MLDIKAATVVKEAINSKIGEVVKLEDVFKMKPVSRITEKSKCSILVMQHGKLTILVEVEFDEKDEISVLKVRTLTW